MRLSPTRRVASSLQLAIATATLHLHVSFWVSGRCREVQTRLDHLILFQGLRSRPHPTMSICISLTHTARYIKVSSPPHTLMSISSKVSGTTNTEDFQLRQLYQSPHTLDISRCNSSPPDAPWGYQCNVKIVSRGLNNEIWANRHQFRTSHAGRCPSCETLGQSARPHEQLPRYIRGVVAKSATARGDRATSRPHPHGSSYRDAHSRHPFSSHMRLAKNFSI
jgi:hypothetical protein